MKKEVKRWIDAEVRYPSDVIPVKKFSKKDAKEVLEKTKGVLEWIKEKI